MAAKTVFVCYEGYYDTTEIREVRLTKRAADAWVKKKPSNPRWYREAVEVPLYTGRGAAKPKGKKKRAK
jgi:hypothetical protein